MAARKKKKVGPKAEFDPHLAHKYETQEMARNLPPSDVYAWLVEHGYFPESYVLPPAFTVTKRPSYQQFYPVTKGGKEYKVPAQELITVQFPRSEMIDRHYGIMHPRIHNDIAYHIAENWEFLVDKMVP